MALAAVDAADRVDQLIILTERLTALLAVEALAFEQRRPQDILDQVEETQRLANIYRHESVRVRAEPALVLGAPAALRQTLVRATEAFDAVLARHGRAVGAAKTVAEGLVRAIAEEVASQREQSAGYSAGGVSSAGAATAITLNRRA